MSAARGSKRKNDVSLTDDETKESKKPKPTKMDEPKEESSGYSFRWDDKGSILPDGTVDHDRLEVTVDDETGIVMVGDSILLHTDQDVVVRTGEAAKLEGTLLARVERMWQDLPRKRAEPGKLMLQARWYFKKQDLEALEGNFTGKISRDELLSKMTDHDLILSNQCDDNDVETIMRRCAVVARKPSSADEERPELPDEAFVSSYKINFGKEGDTPETVELVAYDGEDEPWPTFESDFEDSDDSPASDVESQKPVPSDNVMRSPSITEGTKSIRSRRSTGPSGSSSSSTSSPSPSGDEGSLDYSQDDGDIVDTEGSTAKGHIFIGPGHQVYVPPFTPGGRVKSRHPTLVWKPGAVTDEEIDEYLQASSKFLNDYMEQNDLVIDDPYAPLPSARVEEMIRAENNGKPMTLSRMSTASSLSQARNELTRECKLDKLLATLKDHGYNPRAALVYVAAHPREYLTIWTQKERDTFNSVFRRHSGSLRMISKALSGTKTFKDVVDYHYRFKIPDQFRRYQEKKREQAVRMMECVEQRRSLEASILPRDEAAAEKRKRSEAKRNAEWNKTSVADVTQTVEDRRIAAKELFLQVQHELGSNTMNELALAVKSLKDGDVREVKDVFVEVLHGHPDLLARFLAFLPKRFRGDGPRSTTDMHVF